MKPKKIQKSFLYRLIIWMSSRLSWYETARMKLDMDRLYDKKYREWSLKTYKSDLSPRALLGGQKCPVCYREIPPIK
jgi:hypothetical protein